MSLNVDKVWKETDAGSVLVPVADVQVGDRIVVRTGGVIPLDGKVVAGEAMVNQASITGEPLAVRRAEGGYVYAGTVVEEGDCTICVEKSAGSGRYDRIIRMIEESENSSPQRRITRRTLQTSSFRTVWAQQPWSGS